MLQKLTKLRFKPKNMLPKSLFGRFFLIIIIPMLLVQGIAIYMFYERHWKSVSRNLTFSLANDVALVTDMAIEEGPENIKPLFNKIRKNLGIQISYRDGELTNVKSSGYENLTNELKTRIKNQLVVYKAKGEKVIIEVKLPHRVIVATVAEKRLTNPTTYIYVMWVVGAAIVFVVIAMIFMKNQIRPITRLARAAEMFGRGEDTDFRPHGASEVRRAAAAFIKMKERIRRFLSQRTAMLAGVSHDLRTPLTRMKLQLNLFPESKAREDMLNDIKDMEEMLTGYLNFAKGREAEESKLISFNSFVMEIVRNHQRNFPNIKFTSTKDAMLTFRPNLVKRAFNNVISNSERYANNIYLSSTYDKNYVYLSIDDDGPGIAEDKYSEVFKPFYRIDESRNLSTGGVGLGLSITRDIISLHGGDIVLSKSERGGLKTTMKLPLAPEQEING